MSGVLNRLDLDVLIITINMKSLSVDPPPHPWLGGGDHSCPCGRKLDIGSLVPVHSSSVGVFDLIHDCAFLDPSLKTCHFPAQIFYSLSNIHNMIVLTDVVCYAWVIYGAH